MFYELQVTGKLNAVQYWVDKRFENDSDGAFCIKWFLQRSVL